MGLKWLMNFFLAPRRYMAAAATNRKHINLKIVDSVGVISFDSPGVKVSMTALNLKCTPKY